MSGYGDGMADTEHDAPGPGRPAAQASGADKDTFPPKGGGGLAGTPSEGPSGLGDLETSIGGADAVPDTPDAMPNVAPGAGPEAG